MALPSNVLVLKGTDGAHLGFVLLAPKTAASGDCILKIMPLEPGHFDRPDVARLYERNFDTAGEHSFALEADGVVRIERGTFVLRLVPAADGAFEGELDGMRLRAAWGGRKA